MPRPLAPMTDAVSPAGRALAVALRDHVVAGNWTLKQLAHIAGYAQPRLSEALNGKAIPSTEFLLDLSQALRVDPSEAARLRRLRDQAVAERRGDALERRAQEELHSAALESQAVSRRLKDLQAAVGCSVRDLVEMTAQAGVASSKSTIARVLEDPARDPALAYALADSMVRLLPEDERQRAHSEASLAAFELIRGKSHGDLHPDNILAVPLQAAAFRLIDVSFAQSVDGEADVRLPDGTTVEVKVRAAGSSLSTASADAGEAPRGVSTAGPGADQSDTSSAPLPQFRIRWPDGSVATVRGEGIDAKELFRRAVALGADVELVRVSNPTTLGVEQNSPGRKRVGMDPFTRSLLDRIRATESDLTRAREEGDDFLAEVEQAELDDLRRLAAESDAGTRTDG